MWRVPEDTTIKNNSEKNKLIKPRPPRPHLPENISNIEQGIALDSLGAKDIDDIFWIEAVSSSMYNISIYIPDVTYYLKNNSIFELEARKQLETIYDTTKITQTITLLPPRFSIKYLSLSEGITRKCLKFEFHYSSKTGNCKLKSISKCYAKNIKQYTYEQADFLFKRLDRTNEIDCMLELAREISSNLNYYRSKKNQLLNKRDEERFSARHVVLELMVMCNQLIGNYFVKNNLNGIFLCNKNVNNTSITYYATEASNTPYINVTSPIRKYTDIINHRILKAHLNHKSSRYTLYDLEKICSYANLKLKNYEEKIQEKVFTNLIIDKTGYLSTLTEKTKTGQQLNFKEMVFLIFDTEETEFKKTQLNKIKNNVRIAYNILNNYCTNNNISLIQKIRKEKQSGMIISNVIVNLNGIKYTHEYLGIGITEDESIYNACYQFLLDYVNYNLQTKHTKSIFDMTKYTTSTSNLETSEVHKTNMLKINLKNYIERSIEKKICSVIVLNNLQYKCAKLFNNITFKHEVNTYIKPTIYKTAITAKFFNQDCIYTFEDSSLSLSKEECAKIALENIIEDFL